MLWGCPTIGGGRIPVWENIVTPVGRRRPPRNAQVNARLLLVYQRRRRRRSKKPGADRRAVGGSAGRAQVSGRLNQG